MAVVSMKQLLEAGVHFGHQTRRWNPKMKPFIYTERNGIHIIDLQKTVGALDRAYTFVEDVTRGGGRVLFVGTKKQAQEAVAEEAQRAGQYFVNQRWLGGLLTNFRTIQDRLRRLDELEQMRDTGAMARLPKKEQLKLNDEMAKLNRLLGGIRGMRRLPDALFIIDTRKEHIAIHEAERLDIPVVALVDTNSDPDEVTYPIPANDDAIRAVRLLSAKMADAALEGAQEYASTRAKEEAEEGFEPSAYEGYTFEPEGYEAAIEPASAEPQAEPEAAVAAAGHAEEDVPPTAVQPDETVETAALEQAVPAVPDLAVTQTAASEAPLASDEGAVAVSPEEPIAEAQTDSPAAPAEEVQESATTPARARTRSTRAASPTAGEETEPAPRKRATRTRRTAGGEAEGTDETPTQVETAAGSDGAGAGEAQAVSGQEAAAGEAPSTAEEATPEPVAETNPA